MAPRFQWRLALAALSLWGAAGAQGATIYVRQGGDDRSAGSSPATAVRTITHAALVAKPFDRVVVGPGTYAEGDISPNASGHVSFIADRRGRETGDAPGDVVVDGHGASTGFVLNHNLAITVDGFVISGAPIGVYVKSQSTQTTISNCVVTNSSDNAIYIQDSSNVIVFNCLMFDNARSGILVTGNVSGSPGARVINNSVYGNGDRGIFFSGSTIGSPNGLVINNIVQGNAVAGIEVNPLSRTGYLSAGNVAADHYASGAPVDVADIRADPLFVDSSGQAIDPSGPHTADEFHLSQARAGQRMTSPAVDAGSDLARHLGLSRASTRTDGRPDGGFVDAGYHYDNFDALPRTPLRLRAVPLYVSPNGSDVNDGRTPATALQNPAQALLLAAPGNRVVLLPGTFRLDPTAGGLAVPRSGKPGQPIVVEAVNGAVIDATGVQRGLLVAGKSEIDLIGLDVANASDSGVEIRLGASNVTVQDCHLHNNGRRGIFVDGASNVTIRSSLIEDNRATGMQIQAAQVGVDRTSILENATNGLWATNNSNVVMSNSNVMNNATNGVLAWQSGVTLTGGAIRGSKDGGVRFTQGSTGTLTNVDVSDNTDVGVQGISSTVKIVGGAIQNNTRVGIESIVDTASGGATSLSVIGTQVCGNQGPGINAQDSTVALTRVTLCDNGAEGLRQDGGSAEIMNPMVQQNQTKGISVQGLSKLDIQNATIDHNGDNGVQAADTAAVSISNSVMSANDADGLVTTNSPLAVTGAQVCANHGPGVSAQGAAVTLTNVTLCQNGEEGLRQSGGSVLINNATVEQNHAKGISVDTLTSVTVQSATVDHNRDNGVQISGGMMVSIEDSVLSANGGDGITLLDSPDASIVNNLVSFNVSTGILISGDVTGSPNAEVVNNTVYANTNRGLQIGGSNDQPPSLGAQVFRNIFQANGTAGIQVNQLSISEYSGDYNLSVDPYFILTPVGLHDILSDPLIVDPAHGDFHLMQRAAGQAATSPAVDAGVIDVTTAGLAGLTTRTDRHPDTGPVDLGYHYPQ